MLYDRSAVFRPCCLGGNCFFILNFQFNKFAPVAELADAPDFARVTSVTK